MKDLTAFFKSEFAEHADVARKTEAALAAAFAGLVEACAKLKGDWRLVFVGKGAFQPELEAQVERLGLREKVTFMPMVPSTEVAAYMSGLDTFVLPSRTTANWKEQFGRVIIESMACEVPSQENRVPIMKSPASTRATGV